MTLSERIMREKERYFVSTARDATICVLSRNNFIQLRKELSFSPSSLDMSEENPFIYGMRIVVLEREEDILLVG
ncbi:hypothetical protein GJ688_18555 [Heliobacillus mobilis]|uniref:Uncharacterized protein n=1 Tax=Heliobacterium mobile TaxID=28064 RepID=A0A6I3SRC4_HELMO|nr:hypothetical protein [Heliobacterium mobile]MTV50922.1 hypothetical protein [Heliobacterium mobile]